jgi:hypothetical protein
LVGFPHLTAPSGTFEGELGIYPEKCGYLNSENMGKTVIYWGYKHIQTTISTIYGDFNPDPPDIQKILPYGPKYV